MITIMGASGNTGNKIAKLLIESGEPIRALGRSAESFSELKEAGAELMMGDTNDAAFLAKAFQGADAVYTLLPTDPRATDYRAEQDRQGQAIVTAIRESGVKNVVALSSLGADLSAGTGLVVGLHAQEERLKELRGTNILLLRPVSFFENFYGVLPLIKNEGINADSVEADLPLPMIATADIAEVAAKALKARDWKGVRVRELLGPRDLSHSEATRIIGELIGKPELVYVQSSDANQINALVNAGLSESFATLYVGMTRALNNGTLKPTRNRQNTTATRFEDFAAELVVAYQQL